jgi:SAM-dependent methyltransferase
MALEPDYCFAPIWDGVFQRQHWGRYPPEHVIRFVARAFYGAADRAAVRLLDLGCGPGACAWYMAREGFSVSAIDFSPTAVEQLGQRFAREHLAADVRLGDIAELPWPSGSFDGVVENVVLCANPREKRERAVSEVIRVLKPGGWFCSANFTNRSWGYGLGREVEPGGFVDIAEGPLHGKGFALFMGRAQMDESYRGFAERQVERCSWTSEAERRLVELWIVTCRKAG